ncbi:MAG: LysR family transcriptional regulator, partial [Candidatus Subteraquimicrobiales bacterium]|nr:LysR family transcriptional regulator [Candidatus Subteraquimicrobiales bacterium]
MNLIYFKTFLIVLEKKSFSGAAKELNLTQPAISFQIQAIEKEYGEMLLDRSSSRIAPTETGKIFAYFAKEILRANEVLKESIDEFKGIVRGKLRIGASNIPGEYILPEILGAFKKSFPDVNLALEIGDTEKVIQRLEDREIDLGFVGDAPRKE